MLTLPSNSRIYLHTKPTDMRKSFDGLCALVRSVFQADPLDGSLFLFINRRRDRIKILWWDHDGLALFYKRLEAGTFEAMRTGDDTATLEIDTTQLAMLLGGVTVEGAKRRKRYALAG
jgi:transposase